MKETVKKIPPALFLLMILAGFTASSQTYDGYTLYGKMGNNNVYLLNMDKTVYHTWTNSVATGYSVYLLANHHLLRACQYNGNVMQGAAMCGEVQDLDWNGNVTWQFIYSTSTYCTHHDIHPMPNGNVLMISYEVKTAAQVIAAGGVSNISMWPDKIVEIQPSGSSGGTVVWEWHVWDHLVQDHDASKANYGVVANHPELININYLQQQDWMHTNGIDYNPDLDQIVFSSHNLNEIYVIDHSTTTAQAATHTGGNSGKGGDIIYRWGNPAAYNQGNTSNQDFHVVHDAHWIPTGYPWAGRLVGFNNQGAPGNASCVDMINPPYSGYTYTYTSGAYAPSTYVWRHICSGNAQDQSSSQKLPNGNLLIDIASTGHIYEIDSLQNIIWTTTVGGTVAKAYRYSACYVNGGLTVDATATPTTVCSGGTVQLNVTATGGTTYTYSWTSVPAGFTSSLQNPVVNPTVTTIYIASVTSNSCTGSDSVTVTVTPQPTVTATANPPGVCSGGSSQLNATVNPTGSYTYSWTSIPAGYTSSQQNPVVNPTVTTIYIANVSGNGCTGSDSVTVTLLPEPTVTATATPNEVCAGNATLLNASTSGTLSWAFNWTSVPAGYTSNSQSPVAYPLVSTTYIVNISNYGCSASDSVYVTADPLPPTPVITVLHDTLFSSSSGGNQWYMNSTAIPGATGPYYVVTQAGTYQVKVTDANGCTSSLSDPVIWVGINEGSNYAGIAVYPNPTSGIVNISWDKTVVPEITASVFDLFGRAVINSTDASRLDLSSMPGGIYCLLISSQGNIIFHQKIILYK